MTNSELVKRIEVLERELNVLKLKIEGVPKGDKRWFFATSGIFKDDPDFEDAVRIGREYRESFKPGGRKKRKIKKSGRRATTKVAS
jgi:hypothetical protein